MKTKVCPCCDQPIKGIYCKGCRKLVLKPMEYEIRYYLNTRHPQENHDCTFHDNENIGMSGNMYRGIDASPVRQASHKMTMSETERKKAEIRARMERRKTEDKRQYRSEKPAGQVIGTRTDSHQDRKRIILVLTMVLTVFTILFMSVMMSVINSMNHDFFTTGFTSVQVEPVMPEPREFEVPEIPMLDVSEEAVWEKLSKE